MAVLEEQMLLEKESRLRSGIQRAPSAARDALRAPAVRSAASRWRMASTEARARWTAMPRTAAAPCPPPRATTKAAAATGEPPA